ncbi:MAG: ABC transporter substrate-binding protein [bacterium]
MEEETKSTGLLSRVLNFFKQLRKIPYVLNKKEYRLFKIVFAVIVIMLGISIWQFVIAKTDEVAKPGGTYTEGIKGQPEYINPLLAQTNDADMDLSELIFSGLMRYNGQQELKPDLAEDFPEVSEDEKNYVFHLRQNVTWHDGTPFTADDVLFTVQSIKDRQWQSPLAQNFSGVAVEKVDDYTIKFTLVKDAFSPFLKENTTFGIIPKHLWEGVLAKNARLSELNVKPIGTGPYMVNQFQKDKTYGRIISYQLEPHNNYHLGQPNLKKLNINFYEDYDEIISAYNAGEVDGISYISPAKRGDITRKINFYDPGLPRYYAIFFNNKRNENLQEDAVRQALAHAVDRQRIVDEVLYGQGEVVNSPILANFLGHNPEVKVYKFNKKKAEETLHSAGWNRIDEEGHRWKGETRLEVTLYVNDQQQFIDIANIIKESWNAIGVQTNVQSFDSTTLQTDYIKPREYEALLFGQLLGHDPDPYIFWHSSQRTDPGLNLSSYHDDSIDRLLDEARKTNDEEQRNLKYLDFQNRFAEAIPALLLYSPTYSYGNRTKIKGVDLDYISLPSDRFTDVHLWHIKTKRVWKSSDK